MMYEQESLIESVSISASQPIDYDIKVLIKLNKNLYTIFERTSLRNCLYDKDSQEYLRFKETIKKEIIKNFLAVHAFCSTDGEYIQECPILIKSIIQFIKQFLLDFPLLQIESQYTSLAHFTLFFKLQCSKEIPFSYCLSEKKKYDKITEEGKRIIDALEKTDLEHLLPNILHFLYQIVTFSTLYVKQYTEEEKEIITTIGYLFLKEYQKQEETTPYLLALEDILNCSFKTYTPQKREIKILQKENRINYQNRLIKQTIQGLQKQKKDSDHKT